MQEGDKTKISKSCVGTKSERKKMPNKTKNYV